MGAIISLFAIVAASLVVVRIGTLALVMTGTARKVASFQADSAFFGVGFTTREAELVVADPARRRINKQLILVGNIGLTAGAGSISGRKASLCWVAPAPTRPVESTTPALPRAPSGSRTAIALPSTGTIARLATSCDRGNRGRRGAPVASTLTQTIHFTDMVMWPNLWPLAV